MLAIKCLNEFIGTFFLVLTIGLCVINPGGAGEFAPLAIGSCLAVLVYAGGHISGGHYNPAVSLAIFLREKTSLALLGSYWMAQLIGGIIAAYLVLFFKGHGAESHLVLDPVKALLAEFLFSFALCHIVLNVATSKETAGNSYFGFAIGFIVLAGAYAVGSISGGAFNPAVAFGLAVIEVLHWSQIWIYLIANLLGATFATAIFKLSHDNKV